MKKRILAILALVFFALGVGVFFYCIAAKRTDSFALRGDLLRARRGAGAV